jgi:predicted site-specific integrase-resolvase
MPADVLTRKQAAEILGVSAKRVTNMRWQGQLEPVTTPHRKIGLFDRAQVEALAAVRKGATP